MHSPSGWIYPGRSWLTFCKPSFEPKSKLRIRGSDYQFQVPLLIESGHRCTRQNCYPATMTRKVVKQDDNNNRAV